MFSRSRQGAVDVIAGNDPLSRTHCDEFREAAERCFERGQPRMIVDFARVPFVDSAGMELLLEMRDRCNEMGGRLKVSAPNALCLDAFNATGIAVELEIYPDVVDAAGSFAV